MVNMRVGVAVRCQHTRSCLSPIPPTHATTGGETVYVDARVIKLGRDVATIDVQLRRNSSTGQLVATVSTAPTFCWSTLHAYAP